jgi:hypothetical protein
MSNCARTKMLIPAPQQEFPAVPTVEGAVGSKRCAR